MTTCEPFQSSLFASGEDATSSLEATHASRSLWPGSDEARMMTVTSGQTCAALLTRPDRVSSWQKTLLVTSRWDSTLFLLKWKPTATPAGRLLFRLVPSTRFTAGIASGSWPTPNAAKAASDLNLTKSGDGWAVSDHPWPTPTQDSATDRTERYAQGGTPLTLAVQQDPWPTPRASESEMRTYARTPSAEADKHGKHLQAEVLRANMEFSVDPEEVAEFLRPKLHGRWVLALMGYPPDWCDDLGPTEAGKTDSPAS